MFSSKNEEKKPRIYEARAISLIIVLLQFRSHSNETPISIVMLYKISHSSFINGRVQKHFHADAWIQN